jgi:Mg2+ and Co2+ transporter CorA
VITDTLALLIEQIDEERKRIIDDLGEGKAKDFAQYQFSAGVIRGLLLSQRLVMDLAKRMEDADE